MCGGGDRSGGRRGRRGFGLGFVRREGIRLGRRFRRGDGVGRARLRRWVGLLGQMARKDEVGLLGRLWSLGHLAPCRCQTLEERIPLGREGEGRMGAMFCFF